MTRTKLAPTPAARQRRPTLAGPFLAALACALSACASLGAPRDVGAPDDAPLYAIDWVIDGDTVIIDREGRRETVRLIGIDAPETGEGRRELECFGREATDEARRLMAGRRVRIATDPSQDERDRYDRLLAYVWLADGTFVNQAMVENGYAFEYTYDLPYRYQRALRAAEDRARRAAVGLWSPDACPERRS